ncbi:response regulator transcription factor [Cryobacterium levicorallinum]|uniref:DNA-binding response regulator, OmpR family, contains REC and winged-helix (WHTH) domain n=1 Tax=Cryobacterium levicorallinum TaxID=995038 RepID=A0A1I2YIF0_9MICO|nr:response regulator transcription factor [Cryobacterium levicorallinum]TFB84511.1 response regulator transcription factor [Cryobacterium levicorallinum]SFH24361.1 DNA-binding response regulator, OmpR family, contains REC and winged-helix (wHTH) domain [Cryobacterium levicorallinum]
MVFDNGERRVAVIIEDDADIRNLLEAVLTQAGFETIPTSNGLDGIAAVREHYPIVTTLDVSMPGIDGFETARRIRAFSPTYLVMLTARDDEIDTLQGLDAGADDYMTKPFRPRELRARIEAMLRRPRQPMTTDAVVLAVDAAPAPAPETAPSELVTAGEANAEASASLGPPIPSEESGTVDGWYSHNGLRLNPSERIVQLDGAPLDLTRTEFDLLGALLESQRKVRSKNDLALLLRGEAYASAYPVIEADRRAVEVHMGNLRRKLGDSTATPRWLETVRGVGYRLAAHTGVGN